MQFEQLVLDIGATLELRIPAAGSTAVKGECRGRSRLVGYVPGEGVLATPPRRAGQRILLSDGQQMRLHVANEEGEHSFFTRILGQQKCPLALVFLSYPSGGVSHLLRRHPRIRLQLPVVVYNRSVLNAQQSCVGHLCNISLGGAGIELDNSVAHVGDQLVCHARFCVAGTVRYIRLLGCVRSRLQQVSTLPGRFDSSRARALFGIEFIDSSYDSQLLLQAFVLEKSRLRCVATGFGQAHEGEGRAGIQSSVGD